MFRALTTFSTDTAWPKMAAGSWAQISLSCLPMWSFVFSEFRAGNWPAICSRFELAHRNAGRGGEPPLSLIPITLRDYALVLITIFKFRPTCARAGPIGPSRAEWPRYRPSTRSLACVCVRASERDAVYARKLRRGREGCWLNIRSAVPIIHYSSRIRYMYICASCANYNVRRWSRYLAPDRYRGFICTWDGAFLTPTNFTRDGNGESTKSLLTVLRQFLCDL